MLSSDWPFLCTGGSLSCLRLPVREAGRGWELLRLDPRHVPLLPRWPPSTTAVPAWGRHRRVSAGRKRRPEGKPVSVLRFAGGPAAEGGAPSASLPLSVF